MSDSALRVAVLVDLPREAASGGHVKYWERMAEAAVACAVPLDLTIYFSGTGADEILSPRVRYRFLPPVFSTERLKFLPYVPAHTDLAVFHPALAEQLPHYDVIHTTEGCFNFAQTAERIARWHNIPLVTSLHTDTPVYAEIFTRQLLIDLMGSKIGGFCDRVLKLPARQRRKKNQRLAKHLRSCAAILVMRAEDKKWAQAVSPRAMIAPMRLGVDKDNFKPERRDRTFVEQNYNIPAGRLILLFVGRIDQGKNAQMLIDVCARMIASGANIHLIMAGIGPLAPQAENILGERVTLAGFVTAPDLARLYASVDVLTVTSDVEIGGMIGLEAVASCCPVLVSRRSGMAQACGNPGAMQMIDSDAQAWVAALNAFNDDPAQRQRLRDAALDFRTAHLASWIDVLQQDFTPVWAKVAAKTDKGKQDVCA